MGLKRTRFGEVEVGEGGGEDDECMMNVVYLEDRYFEKIIRLLTSMRSSDDGCCCVLSSDLPIIWSLYTPPSSIQCNFVSRRNQAAKLYPSRVAMLC